MINLKKYKKTCGSHYCRWSPIQNFGCFWLMNVILVMGTIIWHFEKCFHMDTTPGLVFEMIHILLGFSWNNLLTNSNWTFTTFNNANDKYLISFKYDFSHFQILFWIAVSSVALPDRDHLIFQNFEALEPHGFEIPTDRKNKMFNEFEFNYTNTQT